jgi:hypothetical protein
MSAIREEPKKEATLSPRNFIQQQRMNETFREEVEDIAEKCDSALQEASKDIYNMVKT